MVSMPPALVSLLLALTLGLAAGCGGGENVVQTAGPRTAPLRSPRATPPPTSASTRTSTRHSGSAPGAARPLPGRRPALQDRRRADEDGVELGRRREPALGPLTAVVLLRAGSPVVLVQAEDRAKLDALLAKSDEQPVSTVEDGWVAIARTQAELDAYGGHASSAASTRTPRSAPRWRPPADSLASGVRGTRTRAATARSPGGLAETAGADLQSARPATSAGRRRSRLQPVRTRRRARRAELDRSCSPGARRAVRRAVLPGRPTSPSS